MPSSFDPEDPAQIKQLHASIDWSIEQMKPHRVRRIENMAQYVGQGYGDEAAPDAVPINMIELGVNILQRFISSHMPQCMVGSNYKEFLPAAADLELAINQEAKRINLADALNTWVIEALFCMGVLEIGITAGNTPPDSEGYLYDPGHLFVDPVLFDRLILDMCAPRWDLMSYVGHDYDVPYEWVKNNEDFDQEVRAEISSTNEEELDDDVDSTKLSNNRSGLEAFQKMLTLRQIYLPSEKLVLQFVVGQQEKRPLKTQKWTGPERGMYIPLCFGKVPGNLIPNAPVTQWAPMHDQLNSLWNKITDQGARQKTLLLIRGSAAADGQRVIKGNDGDAIYSEDPGGCVEMSTGGANPQTFALAMQTKDTLDWFMGNISALGGLAAQSETLGQDRMLIENASGKPQDLQKTTMDAQVCVFEDMANWLYNDPVSEYHLVKQIGNSGESFSFTWGPEERMGDLTKYNFSVNPFSGVAMSPSQMANIFMQDLQLFMQAEPAMQQQGMGLDWEYIVKELSKFRNMPQIRRMIRFVQGEAYPERGAVQKQGMPANTTRTNVRVNKPMGTQQGKSQTLISSLMGGNPQEAEMAGLLRPSA